MTDPVRILVVDDLPAQRLTIEAALAELGEEVVCVGSGRAALKYLLEHDAAVILLDVNMPDMDGFETAALIRQRPSTADTPIIFLTADTDEMLAARGYELGAVDYLIRPFLPQVLRTKVRVFVALSRARERVKRQAEERVALGRAQAARAAAEEQSRRMHLLAEATGLLTRSLDAPTLADDLLRLLVPERFGFAGIAFGGAAPLWCRGGARGVETGGAELVAPELAAALERARRTGAEVADGAGDVLALPLLARGTTHGALVVAAPSPAVLGNAAEAELLRDVASRAAIALDNRRLYQELSERDRRKDEFLAMLSHELRNPLGAITTSVQLLQLLPADDPKGGHARDIIARQSQHLTRILDDLLEVSRVTSGRIVLERHAVDLRDVVQRAVDALRAAGRLDQHEVHLRGESVLVHADAARLEQVVTNLVVNAAKYTDPGGRVDVAVGGDERDAWLRVRDTGIGIEPELLPRLFDVFVQGRQALNRAEGGLGVGLALVRKLLELHGGDIDVASPGPGRGSTFTARLPRLSEPVMPAAPAAPRAAMRPMRVLLVEDHADAREMLRALLETEGHQVHEASSGTEGLEVAQRVRPQVALVDIGLPGLDGFEVARRLRARVPQAELVLVAVSGYGADEDRRRGREAGFDAHLVKPVSADRLRQALDVAAERFGAPPVRALSAD